MASNSLPPIDSEGIQRLIEETGIYDLDAVPPDYHARAAKASSRSNRGLFVRGARTGGSPMLNLLSHFAFWVSLLILVALGGLLVWGGKTAYRALVPSGSTTALVAGPGETVCAPVKLSRAERAAVPKIMGRLGEVVLGDGAISRAPEDLEKMGGRTSWLGPDRVDRFDLDGMLLAVQYGGTSEVVRAVSVRLRSPRTLCRALQDVGLLPEQAKFRVDDRGRVFATGGKPAPAFVRGASVQVLVENAGVALVQISAPAE